MSNVQKFRDQVNMSSFTREELLNQQIAVLELEKQIVVNTTCIADQNIATIINAVDSCKLSVTELYFDPKYNRFEIQAVPLNPNTYFLKHKGYNRKGASINQIARRNKSQKIKDMINSALAIINAHCSVNDHSLELDRTDNVDRARVLITISMNQK